MERARRARLAATLKMLQRSRLERDLARGRDGEESGDDAVLAPVKGPKIVMERPRPDPAAFDRALTKLAALDQRQGLLIELRFVAGLTDSDIAYLLALPERIVRREFAVARARLFRELSLSAER